MKVYILIGEELGCCEFDEEWIGHVYGVFDSEEKVEEYIKRTIPKAKVTYNGKTKYWEVDYDARMKVEEWEVK